ncbi:MAG TPA: hypothetical protein PKW95_13315 [bacterium]|nr:hypothetical protein [bacterium]
MDDVRERISSVCQGLERMLLAKNETYGNSALDPVRVFSKTDPIEQIKVRIDDKISRLARGGEDLAAVGESYLDTIQDLIGYLVLLLVAIERSRE